MEILSIQQNDIPECAEAFMAAYNSMPWNYKWQLPDAVKYLAEYAGAPHFHGYMLIENGVAAGALLGHTKTWWTGSQFMIDELFVNPAMQGKGYGKLLLQQAGQYANEQGITLLTLMTNKFMPAMQFYDKNDFNKVEQYVFMFRHL